MFRTHNLAAALIALIPVASMPLAAAQSQAPKAKSAAVFSQSRSYLGIGVLDVTEERARALALKEPQGVEVTSVTEDAPAAKAGIRQGDIILEYNGQRVEGGTQFVRMVQETPAGHKAEMQIWRNGAKQSITATIGSRSGTPWAFVVPNAPMPPMPPQLPMIPDTPHDMFSWRSTTLGVETESLNSQLAEFFGVKEGVLVRAVTKGSAAETSGLKAGDVITKIDGQGVSSPRNITALLRKSDRNVTLTVVRNHKEITLNVKISLKSQPWDDFPGALPAFRQESREIL
jgi:serine protease Do